jgi:NAD(P)-dependent dehydrogenase (short-subunit alcohol dehydrogenase family)
MILKDKIIVVTGGSGLIGKAIVHDIQKKGGLAINADIAFDSNLQTKNVLMDITDDNSIHQGIDLIIRQFGHIDGLVNNAYPRTKDWGNKFEEVSPDSWRKNVDMQLNSCFVLCKKVLESMTKRKSGSIVNIASIYGVVGNNFNVYEGTTLTSPAAYSAIKGGIINFTRYLASYFGKDNIRINCVSPGGIFDHQNPIFIQNYEHIVPLKRMGKPEDIAPAVSFLLSDEANYITGHNLIVDGGWTAI